ncbi:MAG: P1 family peptidase, partial [Chloroflexota bacterium]
GDVRPDAAMGYAACQSATSDAVEQGTIGAGTGCRIGAGMGNDFATKGGIGTASIDLGDGLIVSALIAVNAVGDVVDQAGQIIAGLRQPPDGNTFAGSLNMMRMMSRMVDTPTEGNTVIGVVATNAKLTKEQVNKVAQMAHDGIAQAIRPAHTMFDGDTLFALATGQIPANVNAVGAFAAEAVAQAIRSAVQAATSLAGVRSLKD